MLIPEVKQRNVGSLQQTRLVLAFLTVHVPRVAVMAKAEARASGQSDGLKRTSCLTGVDG
jgi:hypothetical protein